MNRAITSLREISRVVAEEADPKRVLKAISEIVARAFSAEVCSIYVHEPASNELVMSANIGFPPGAGQSVRLKADEGLTGLAFSTGEPVAVAVAALENRYRYFPQTLEEQFPSFLAVPLRCSGKAIGVLVIQRREVRQHDQNEIDALRTLCVPISQAIEILNLRALGPAGAALGPGAESRGPDPEFLGLTFRGIGVSPGIAIGPVLLRGFCLPENESDLRPSGDPDREAERFRQAAESARGHLARVRGEAGDGASNGETAILDAYSALLDDHGLPGRVLAHIARGHRAESALRIVVVDSMAGLEQAQDDYLRDRAFDIQEVGRMLLDSLAGPTCGGPVPEQGGPFILVTRSLGVTDLLGPGGKHLSGIVSVEGGVHSHASIVARSLQIPLVIGPRGIETSLADGVSVIVNGSAGLIHVDPPPVVRQAYEKEQAARVVEKGSESALPKPRAPRATTTRDGRRVTIGANVGLLSHLEAARRAGAEEIGLYRTELPFLIRRTFPTEEDQVQLYRQAVELMEGRPVTIRTLDVGGDREIPYLTARGEENPALGWRSIRISLGREDLFRIQLRAILRAGAKKSVRLLLPMISQIEEIRRTREILGELKRELAAEGLEHDPDIPLGAMIEVPAAALIIEKILAEVDFVSIGTNDLVQYTLAVDRTNTKVSTLFDPYHPAVLRLVHAVAESANRVGKPVTVCGESASEPRYAALLVGLGVRGLSVEPAAIPRLQEALGAARFQELEAIAHKVLKAASVVELRAEAFAHLGAVGFSESPDPGAPRLPSIALQYP